MLGQSLDAARRSELFTFFHFECVERNQRPGGSSEVEFRPQGPAFREFVRLRVTVNDGQCIQALTLEVARAFIDHPAQGIFAADLVKSFLLAAVPSDDRAALEPLAEEIFSRREGGSLVLATAPAPPPPAGPPSPGWEVFRGRRESHPLPLPHAGVRLANLRRPGAAFLEISVDPAAASTAAPAPVIAPTRTTSLPPVHPAHDAPTPQLLDWLEGEDRLRAYDAAWALWPRLQNDAGATSWQGDAGHPEGARRALAAMALARAGADAEAAIVRLAGDPARGVRLSSALALGMLEERTGSATIATLARLLGDPDWAVRIMAANALRLLGPRGAAAVPALMRTLGDEKARYMAARALAEMGNAARAAIEPLEVLAGRRLGAASDAAAEAIAAIRRARR